MKNLLLSLFVIVPMVPETAAASAPVSALTPLMLAAPKRTLTEAPSTATPDITPVAQVLTCEGALDKMVADLQAGKLISSVNSTLIIGETARAESPHFPLGAGFNVSGGTATRSGSKIVGTSHVAAPGSTSGADLEFTIEKSNSKARLEWTYAGKKYASVVDGCLSGYWIASSSASAIAIKIGAVVTPAPPPH